MSTEQQNETCGVVMPISAIDSCSEEHWRDVKSILFEAIEDSGFTPQLVSDADDVGIIQKRIIQNLYENPVVVCDVSAKNPNVMFELGMRLAFDRPTIIIKDDKTSYSFDTSPVEHLTYPRDLRFSRIVDFKDALSEKIKATFEKSKSDPTYTTFLKNFGTFKAIELKTELVPQDRIIIEEIKNLQEAFQSLSSNMRQLGGRQIARQSYVLCMRQATEELTNAFTRDISSAVKAANKIQTTHNNHTHITFEDIDRDQRINILKIARTYIPDSRWLNNPPIIERNIHL